MKNRDVEAAWSYHNGTKHSNQSIRTNPHYMDWENQPLPFKIYSKLEPIPLTNRHSPSGVAALSAIAGTGAQSEGLFVPDEDTLAELLRLSGGITKRRTHAGGEVFFRAAACTGALYHIDLYLVCGELPDLKPGVYHFGPHDFALRRLRDGDYRAVIVSATGREPAVASAPVIVISVSTYWRNAWKYQARTYRHCYWDNGTILANLLAAAVARGLSARVVAGFVDESVNRLLGLDTEREAALSLVPLGNIPAMAPGPSPEVEPLTMETVPLSEKEVDYPAIRAMHKASSLESDDEVVAWCRHSQVGVQTGQSRQPSGRLFPLRPLGDQEISRDVVEEVILRRGSTRQFSQDSIPFAQLSTMLCQATRGIPADFLKHGETLNELYLIVNAVDDLPSGAYVFHRNTLALELLKEGNLRREAGYLGLGQHIPADASVDVFILTDLRMVLERFGNRGYRAAQLEASITGGKLYLSAYAQGLGASGLTFFDDDVTEFFSPHAADKSVMFLVALGKTVKRIRK